MYGARAQEALLEAGARADDLSVALDEFVALRTGRTRGVQAGAGAGSRGEERSTRRRRAAHDALVEVHARLLEVEHEQLQHAAVRVVHAGRARHLAFAQHPLALRVQRSIRVQTEHTEQTAHALVLLYSLHFYTLLIQWFCFHARSTVKFLILSFERESVCVCVCV